MPLYTKQDKALALKNMNLLEISHLKDKSFNELSGGQQQRVLLARALCATKKLLLLDEPAAGLDPVAIKELYSTINRLNKENLITVIMVSHDIDKAIENATHILHLEHNNYFFGTVYEYVKSDFLKKFNGGN